MSPDGRIPTTFADLVRAYPTVYKPWQPGDPAPYEAEVDVDFQVEARLERELFEPDLGGDDGRPEGWA